MHDSNQPAPKDGLAVQFMEFDGEVYDKESITMETLDKMIRFIMTAREASVFLSLDEYGEDGDSFVTADVENGWAAVAFNGWNEDGTPYMYQPVSQEGGAEEAPVCIGGQTPVAMRNALHDIALAANCLHYFALTGERYPWVEWEQTA